LSVEDGRTPASLADYFSLLWRRKWIFLVTAFVVPAIAVAISLKSPATWEVPVKVMLPQNTLPGTQGGSIDPSRDAQTQAELARTLDVTQQAVNAAGVPGLTPAGLLTHSSVVPSLGSDFLTFSVRGSDPAIAELVVTAYAKAFAAYRY
jgi:uncharacterized protein involved in exopolysaccharide biosynthesis